jgi:rubredoxin
VQKLNYLQGGNAMRKYKCSVCGYVYDEAKGVPEKGIAPGTKWDNIPGDFVCPLCGAPKSVFKPEDDSALKPATTPADDTPAMNPKEFSAGELSAIFSSLAKGCEKQRLGAETDAFNALADYFKANGGVESGLSFNDLSDGLDGDITKGLVSARKVAEDNSDRGALRSVVWSEKVSAMQKALLERFEKEGDAMLENTNTYVCDVCGFIYIGETKPDICPVCKVPNYRIDQVERR